MSDNPELELGSMSRASVDIDNNLTDVPRASHRTSQPEAGFSDGSGALFSIYLKTAEEEDKKMTDRWKGDADGILVFTGLFSATVAAFLVVANQGLQPNAQDISAFYLAHIYQVTAAGSTTGPALPFPPKLSDPSTFTPPTSAIWVNILWFMSLIISLTCALLATLLQQWARRYLQLTGTRYSLQKRARIRAFFAEGLEKRYFPWVAEAPPGLLHASVFLFFAGLPIFLFGTNHTIFAAVLLCVGASGLSYLLITFMPLVFHDSPYHTPLSALLWLSNAGIRSLSTKLFGFAVSFYLQLHAFIRAHFQIRLFWHAPSHRILTKLSALVKAQNERLEGGLVKEMENSALESSWEIDPRAFLWAFDLLDDEHELEEMLAAIPGFYNSALVKDSQKIISAVASERISNSILQLMDCSLSSDLVHGALRQRRSAICSKVLEMLPDLRRVTIQQSLLFIGAGVFKWTELGLLADRDDTLESKCVTALVTTHTRGSDERWYPVMIRQLGVSEPVLHQYLTQLEADDVLFLNLLNFVRYLFHPHHLPSRSDFRAVENVLNALRKFDASATSPELQHQFCALWNAVLYVQQILASVGIQELTGGDPLLGRAYLRFMMSVLPAVITDMPSLHDAEYFASSFIRNLAGYDSLIRLVLNRLAAVFIALHPSPGDGEATIPVQVPQVANAWNEDSRAELFIPPL